MMDELKHVVQGDFRSCADILTCDSELIVPFTNVDTFREKGVKSCSKKFGSH
jgi:hypothetical protein